MTEASVIELYCPKCDYNLHGLESDRCPECGLDLAGVHSAESGIPWVHRKASGRIRSYWRTVAMVLFRFGRFCSEAYRPVAYADSQRFRWVTVLLVWVSLLAGMYGGWLTRSWWLSLKPPATPTTFELWGSAVVVAVCVLMWLAAATGIFSYFCHPRSAAVSRQNRAIALSYYAQAGLTFWIPSGWLLLGYALLSENAPDVALWLLILSVIFGVVGLLVWFGLPLLTMVRVLTYGLFRMVLNTLLILVIQSIVLVIFLGILPVVAAYLALFCVSVFGS
jgi:hypothetical protein